MTRAALNDPGDDGAFAVALVAHRPYLFKLALKLCRDEARAEDLAAEAIAKGFIHRASFEPGSNLRGWLTFILRNHFLTEQRRKKWDGGYVDDMTGLHPAGPAGQEDKVHLNDLIKAMELLPADQAEAIVAVSLYGSYEEAAEAMSVAEGTIKSRVKRGRTALRELIA